MNETGYIRFSLATLQNFVTESFLGDLVYTCTLITRNKL